MFKTRLRLVAGLLLLVAVLCGGYVAWTNLDQEVNAATTISRVWPEQGSSLGGTNVQVQGSGFAAEMTDIALGGEFSCGINDGKVYCWGRNDYGQLGDGTTTNRLVPTPVNTSGALNGSTVQSITAGLYHACAIAGNMAYCWGRNDTGQLGNGGYTDSAVPVMVMNTNHSALSGLDITAISASNNSTCVIASDTKVYCWGFGDQGQLGDGTWTGKPAPVMAFIGSYGDLTAEAISGGGEHFCALSGGAVACWGDGAYGQLGSGTLGASTLADYIDTSGVLSGLTITAVAAGGDHTCALASNQQAYCWGRNDSGQLGNNTTTDSAVPVAVSPSTDYYLNSTYATITAGYNYTCGTGADGYYTKDIVYCWGSNSSQQIGGEDISNKLTPTTVILFVTSITATRVIASHGDGVMSQHTCSVALSSNVLMCWGAGGDNSTSKGQLGNGFATGASTYDYNRIYTTWVTAVSLGGSGCTITATIIWAVYCTTTPHTVGQVDAIITLATGVQITQTNGFAYVDPPPAPTNLTAAQHSSTSIMLNWTASTGADNYLAQYKLSSATDWINAYDVFDIGLEDYCDDHHTVSSVQYISPQCITGTSFAVPNLITGQAYDFRVAAHVNQTYITGPWSNIASATIIDLSITSITPDHGIVDGGTAVTINGAGFTDSLADIQQINTTGESTCVTSNGQPYCWSSYDDNVASLAMPLPDQGDLTGLTVKSLVQSTGDEGGRFQCVIASDDQLYCFGNDLNGNNVPTLVTDSLLNGKTIKQASTSDGICVVANDDKVYCRGYINGQGADGGDGDNFALVNIPNLTGVKRVEMSRELACAQTNDNAIYCWGEEDMEFWSQAAKDAAPAEGAPWSDRQQYWDQFSNRPLLFDVNNVLDGVVIEKIVALDQRGTLLLDDNGNLYCWGYEEIICGDKTWDMINDEGGDGYTEPRLVDLSATAMAGHKVVDIDGGGDVYFLVDENGAVYVGDDDGDKTVLAIDTSILNSAPIRKISINPMFREVFAVDDNDKVYKFSVFDYDENNEIYIIGPDDIYTINTDNLPQSPPRVTLGGTPCTNTVLVNPTTITCNTPPHTAGAVDVTVDNSQIATLSLGYTYEDIYISVTPDNQNLQIGGNKIIPTLTGSFAFSPNTLAIKTNNPTGFTLSISTNSASNALNHVSLLSTSIAATSGTWTTKSTLANNTWGFTLTSSPSDNQNVWTAVPSASSPLQIKSTNGPNETILGDQTTINFGAKVDLTKPSGKYQTVVVYTVVGET